MLDQSFNFFCRQAVPESGETLRKSETESEVELPPATQTPDEKAEDYGKGVIFYLKDNVVVGVLLWNVFNKISVARKVIRDNKQVLMSPPVNFLL